MTKYAQADAILNYNIEFNVNGQLVHPDSATITVLKNDGTVADSIEAVALTVVDANTNTVYAISAAANAKTLPYEIRYVKVNFTWNGQDYETFDNYVVQENLLIPVSKQDIRNFLSFSASELPDDQIDIMAAYAQLGDDTKITLSDIFTNGSALAPYVIEGIKAKTALNSCIMLELMIAQTEQADNDIFKRYTTVDFQALLDRLTNMYSEAIGLVTETEPTDILFFSAFTDTDPITGT